MKRLILFAAAGLLLAACAGKGKGANTSADSTAADGTPATTAATIEISDTAAATAAIIAQVEALYKALNSYDWEKDTYNLDDKLTKRFAAKVWRQAVADIDSIDSARKGEMSFFESEISPDFMTWSYEYDGHVDVSNISVVSIQDGVAHVEFDMKGAGREPETGSWDMIQEDGQWRVKTVYYHTNNILAMMHQYIDEKIWYYGKRFDIHKYLADINKQARKALDSDAGIVVTEYELYDIDRDGTPEVIVHCPEWAAMMVFAVGSGKAELLVSTETTLTLVLYDHGAGAVGGCGTGCSQGYFARISKSRCVSKVSNYEQYDPEGNVIESRWETDKGQQLTNAQGEQLLRELGQSYTIEPRWQDIDME